jgi:DNA-binding transcriptional LysR family regulator
MPRSSAATATACLPSLALGETGAIDTGHLASYPLRLPDSGYSVRKKFDAACRLAEVEPNILLESRAPHTLLALAEAGHGIAIIPSILSTELLYIEDYPHCPPAQTASRGAGRSVRQAAADPVLRQKVLRAARRFHGTRPSQLRSRRRERIA